MSAWCGVTEFHGSMEIPRELIHLNSKMYKRKRENTQYVNRPYRVPFKRPRQVGQFTAPVQRVGFGSVARARGAAVTGEMKYFDCDRTIVAISACTTTWVAGTIIDPGTTIDLGGAAVATPLCLFCPMVGAALNQRIGRAVKMMAVRINGGIIVPTQVTQSQADGSTRVRLVLVMDMQTNSAQMTGAQLFRDATAAATTIASFQNPNNFGRFKILKEKTYNIGDIAMTGSPTAGDVIQSGRVMHFKLGAKFKTPVVVRFNATNGGTVADIIDNSLHLIVACESAAYQPNIQYYSRVTYKE